MYVQSWTTKRPHHTPLKKVGSSAPTVNLLSPGGRLQPVLMRHPVPAICQNLGGAVGGGGGSSRGSGVGSSQGSVAGGCRIQAPGPAAPPPGYLPPHPGGDRCQVTPPPPPPPPAGVDKHHRQRTNYSRTLRRIYDRSVACCTPPKALKYTLTYRVRMVPCK